MEGEVAGVIPSTDTVPQQGHLTLNVCIAAQTGMENELKLAKV